MREEQVFFTKTKEVFTLGGPQTQTMESPVQLIVDNAISSFSHQPTPEVKQMVQEMNKQVLSRISSRTYRIIIQKEDPVSKIFDFASGFSVAPGITLFYQYSIRPKGIWLVLKHCVERGIFARANNGTFVDATFVDSSASSKLDITKNLISKADCSFLSKYSPVEPLYGQTTDFTGTLQNIPFMFKGGFDVALFEGDAAPTGYLLPDPTFDTLKVNSGVYMLSYPGKWMIYITTTK